jgi:hypothetical protein
LAVHPLWPPQPLSCARENDFWWAAAAVYLLGDSQNEE